MANTFPSRATPALRAYRTAADGSRTTFDCAADRQIPLVDRVTVVCDDGATRQRIVDTAIDLGLVAVATRAGDRPALLIQDRRSAPVHACSLLSARCVLGVCGEPEPTVDLRAATEEGDDFDDGYMSPSDYARSQDGHLGEEWASC